jgi:hypothetical protein
MRRRLCIKSYVEKSIKLSGVIKRVQFDFIKKMRELFEIFITFFIIKSSHLIENNLMIGSTYKIGGYFFRGYNVPQ